MSPRFLFALACFTATIAVTSARADQSLERRASWKVHDSAAMAAMLEASLTDLGLAANEAGQTSERFQDALADGADPLDAYVEAIRARVPIVDELVATAAKSRTAAAASIDPNTPGYGAIESLPKSMRMSVRAWLGRELVRSRLYDEALPTVAEIDPVASIDPASVLFYRGACYHALLMKKEALADLRRLLENEQQAPVRFARTAKLMVADIKPLEEDSLDEISRMMTDVTRRLELGRSNDEVKEREQEIIDKLTKLIDKLEEQQQQQQQQQQASGQSGGQGGQGAPMQDSEIAETKGSGDADRKNQADSGGWGNLPPAERHEAIQQIGRDLPTHYREAIEAYFRKLATDGAAG